MEIKELELKYMRVRRRVSYNPQQKIAEIKPRTSTVAESRMLRLQKMIVSTEKKKHRERRKYWLQESMKA